MGDYLLAVFVFFIAFPFGFWRARVPFRSRDWFLAVHIPVIFIIVLRIVNKVFYHVGFTWRSLFLNVTAFFVAQFIAGLIYKYYIRKKDTSG
jgi:hypothetical protein